MRTPTARRFRPAGDRPPRRRAAQAALAVRITSMSGARAVDDVFADPDRRSLILI